MTTPPIQGRDTDWFAVATSLCLPPITSTTPGERDMADHTNGTGASQVLADEYEESGPDHDETSPGQLAHDVFVTLRDHLPGLAWAYVTREGAIECALDNGGTFQLVIEA